MSIEVDENSGMVAVNVADHGGDGDCEGERLTPGGARELAAELIAAAERAEPIFAAQRALCAVEHEWGLPWNSVRAFEKVTVRSCRRGACREREVSPGWLPFEPKAHQRPFGLAIDCTGPGCDACDACDDEALGAYVAATLADGLERMRSAAA